MIGNAIVLVVMTGGQPIRNSFMPAVRRASRVAGNYIHGVKLAISNGGVPGGATKALADKKLIL